jgi:hypothetical protein
MHIPRRCCSADRPPCPSPFLDLGSYDHPQYCLCAFAFCLFHVLFRLHFFVNPFHCVLNSRLRQRRSAL